MIPVTSQASWESQVSVADTVDDSVRGGWGGGGRWEVEEVTEGEVLLENAEEVRDFRELQKRQQKQV